MSRERALLDQKTLEKAAPTRPTSPATSGLIKPAISGVSFLGTPETLETNVTNTKRRVMLVKCHRAGRHPSFIFVKAIRR